jgi:hypothetical protein
VTKFADVRHIDIDNVTSMETILQVLRTLDTELPNSSLSRLVIFNKAYIVVTRTVKEASDNHYFKNPDFVALFSVCFAKYYFQVINDASHSDTQLPPAWEKLMHGHSKDNQPVFIALLLGANAHINYDLPLALLDVDTKLSREFVNDIMKVDKLLIRSGKEILTLFDEPNKLLHVIKQHGRWLYFRPTMYLILYWRISAWRSYNEVKRRGATTGSSMQKSTKIANRFLRLGRLFRVSARATTTT